MYVHVCCAFQDYIEYNKWVAQGKNPQDYLSFSSTHYLVYDSQTEIHRISTARLMLLAE